ncbi:cytochrome P450 [Marasmius fiardii PR-910]|nr:cytochrome P450 [Marasmius fiardii PR-910]
MQYHWELCQQFIWLRVGQSHVSSAGIFLVLVTLWKQASFPGETSDRSKIKRHTSSSEVLFTERNMLTQIALAVILLVPLYIVLRRVLGTHPLDKIPGPRSPSWRTGYFEEVFGVKGFDFHFKMADRYGPTFSFKTVYGERQLYTFDPKAMNHILVKSQGTLYEETPAFLESFRLMFGGGLLGSRGEPHRKQRKMMTPVFSIAHMREMVPIFYEVTHRLQKSLILKVQDGPKEIDMLSWMGRTALELIGQSGFGYSFDDLADEERAHPFVVALKALPPLFSRAFFARTYILPYVSHIGTASMRRFVARLLPWKDFQEGKGMADYVWELSREILEEKRSTVNRLGKELGGKDILSVLVQENEKASGEDRLSENELIAQMSTLIFAAMDTTSNALARILSQLTAHPEVQEKLREEIDNAFQDGDVSYDQLVSLPYLDAVARETLRLYPPIHRLLRTTLKDTVLPLSHPVTCTDGSIVKEIPLPRNTDIFISIANSNRDKSVWGDDADEWKPERWLEPLPSKVIDVRIPGVYSHLMTFNGGGRSCIGFKFSQLEMKVVLSVLVRTFEFSDAGKEILWQSTAVVSPVVVSSGGASHRRPQMPLVVKLRQ